MVNTSRTIFFSDAFWSTYPKYALNGLLGIIFPIKTPGSSENGEKNYRVTKKKIVSLEFEIWDKFFNSYLFQEKYLLGLHNWHKPFSSLIGSPSVSTFIIEIGYTDGTIRDTKPIAPTVLLMFTRRIKY